MKHLSFSTLATGIFASCLAPFAASAGQDNLYNLNVYLESRIAADEPGCMAAVFQDGRTVDFAARGMAELENPVPLSEQGVFEIASVSKQFTAMSLLLLQEDGALDLDDPIRTFFPELPDWADTMTVRQMLTHTSGMRDYSTMQYYRGDPVEAYFDTGDIVAMTLRQKNTDFEPGTGEEYSNTAFVFLGILVERVSGKSLADFAKARIFQPLGMTHTQFYDDPHAVIEHRVYGYAPNSDGSIGRDVSPRGVVGDAGILTTVDDLRKWDENFYHNKLGGGADLIAEMETVATLKDGTQTPTAMGLYVREYHGLKQVAHTGYYGGFKAALNRYPEIHRSLMMVCNNEAYSPIHMMHDLLPKVLADKVTIEPKSRKKKSEDEAVSAPKPATAKHLEPGRYYSDELDTYWLVSGSQGGITLQLPNGDPSPLTLTDSGSLTSGDFFELVPAPTSNSAEAFDVVYSGYSGVRFVRQ